MNLSGLVVLANSIRCKGDLEEFSACHSVRRFLYLRAFPKLGIIFCGEE